MQVNSSYGIVIDSFDTILADQLATIQQTFTDAKDITSPVYALTYLNSQGIYILQQALQTLWNCINADTANGLGLSILAQNIFNMQRNENAISYLTAFLLVTVDSSSTGILPIGTSLTFTNSTPNFPYLTTSPLSITNTFNSTQIFSVKVIFRSTDSTTQIPVNDASSVSVTLPSNSNIFLVELDTINVIVNGYVSSASSLLPVDSDEMLQLKRKAYLAILGQTSLGIQKAIQNLNISALKTAYVQEYITATINGIIVFLDYPTITPTLAANNNFDTSDTNLQQIAQTIYDYKPFGIVSLGINGATTGDTAFTVTRDFSANPSSSLTSGYSSIVYLNPMQYAPVLMTLVLNVTVFPGDANSANGIFPSTKTDPAVLKPELLSLVNSYFTSKFLATDNTFTTAEVLDQIQKNYTGILGVTTFYFADTGTPGTPLSYIVRQTGFVFQLLNANFTFTLNVKTTG